MPKLRPYTVKERAVRLTKAYVKNGMSHVKTAKALGISRPAVTQALKRPAVQKALAKVNEDALKRAGVRMSKVYKCLDEALEANLTGSFQGQVFPSKEPDHAIRVKTAVECLELTGRKKTAHSDDITKPTEIHVHYGHRDKPRVSTVRPA